MNNLLKFARDAVILVRLLYEQRRTRSDLLQLKQQIQSSGKRKEAWKKIQIISIEVRHMLEEMQNLLEETAEKRKEALKRIQIRSTEVRRMVEEMQNLNGIPEETAEKRKEALQRIQIILTDVQRMVEEMQNLKKSPQETEAGINNCFDPIDKEAEAIMNYAARKREGKDEDDGCHEQAGFV